jgi:hypothetical protein
MNCTIFELFLYKFYKNIFLISKLERIGVLICRTVAC